MNPLKSSILNKIVKITSALFVFLFCVSELKAQDSRIIFLENNQIYELISRLQDRGIMLGLNPDDLPYYRQEVLDELSNIDESELSRLSEKWVQSLKEALIPIKQEETESTFIDLSSEGGLQVNNTERRDMYRPSSDNVYLWPLLELNPTLMNHGFVLNANVKFDYFYDRDPDGIDAVNRWYTRNEKGYVGFASSFIQAYAGRYSSHWGSYDEAAALISNNPRTYDRIDIRLKTKHLHISTLFGFLDNISSSGVFSGVSRNDLESRRRFISSKRVDWRPNKDFKISYRESILYSGFRSIPEIKYLIPVNSATFLADNTPQNDVINLLFGLSVWKRVDQLTLKGELILDDIIFNRVGRGITERGTFSWIFNSTYVLKQKPISIHLNSEIISYQSYNTDQAEGRYLYLGRGLATPFNDYVLTDLKVDWFMDESVSGLRVSPYYGVLLQGEQRIDQPFTSSYEDGSPFEFVLTGVVEKTHRLGIDLFYGPSQFWWVKLDIGHNTKFNTNHVEGDTSNRIVGTVEVGFRYNFSFFE